MKVQKLNVVKEIGEKELPFYKKRGFVQIDDKGNPVEQLEAVSDADARIAELEKTVAEMDAAIAEKDARIAELEKALAEKPNK